MDEVKILYRDDHLLAVYKPAGIHVHRTALSLGEPALHEKLQRQLGIPLFPVHRLDRPTSGLLLFALSSSSSSALCAAFREQTVHKTYWAVVRGWPEDRFSCEKPVRIERREKEKLEAMTTFRTLQRFEHPWPWRGFSSFRCALVEVCPHTGRRHQIRQHCDTLSHPILGDTLWGDTKLNNYLKEKMGLDRLLLICRAMEVPHPITGLSLELSAPLEQHEKELLAALGWPGENRPTGQDEFSVI